MTYPGKRRAAPHESGFTLLEVLVAIAILSFIMAIIYSSFSAIAESKRRMTSAYEVESRAGNLLQMMVQEVSSLYLPIQGYGGTTEDQSLNYGFSGRTVDGLQRLDFTATVSDSGSPRQSSLRETGYYLLPKEEGGYRLFKRIDMTPDEDFQSGGEDFFLMDEIDELRFQFIKKGEDWKDDWEATSVSALPDCVKITVSLIDEDSEKVEFETEVSPYLGKNY